MDTDSYESKEDFLNALILIMQEPGDSAELEIVKGRKTYRIIVYLEDVKEATVQ